MVQYPDVIHTCTWDNRLLNNNKKALQNKWKFKVNGIGEKLNKLLFYHPKVSPDSENDSDILCFENRYWPKNLGLQIQDLSNKHSCSLSKFSEDILNSMCRKIWFNSWFGLILEIGCFDRPGKSASFDDLSYSEAAVWIKMVSGWLCLLVYIWTLMAPALFPDRDFS